MSDYPPPPWKRQGPQHRSLEQERRNARLPGGSRQAGSGRLPMRHRDNILDNLLIETRFTDGERYCIIGKEWDDIASEAAKTPDPLGIGLLPGMQIDLQHRQLLVIPLRFHIEAKQELAILRDQVQMLKEQLADAN